VRQPLGQHFLRDPHVVQTILAAAELKPDDTVLEIGPGQGVMTRELVRRVKDVVAVELDARLAQSLQSLPHCRIIQGDILKTDLDSLFRGVPIKILGNLPYAITSPIFEKLLAWPHWTTGVFLIQREVADRMRSGPGSRTFGILSLAVQVFAQAEIILRVKPGAFSPPPRVTSAVIRLRRKEAPDVPEPDLPFFFDLAHGAFAHRRKTLANSLAFHVSAPKEKIESWLRTQRIDPAARAESLGLADYARMAGPWAIFRRETNLTS